MLCKTSIPAQFYPHLHFFVQPLKVIQTVFFYIRCSESGFECEMSLTVSCPWTLVSELLMLFGEVLGTSGRKFLKTWKVLVVRWMREGRQHLRDGLESVARPCFLPCLVVWESHRTEDVTGLLRYAQTAFVLLHPAPCFPHHSWLLKVWGRINLSPLKLLPIGCLVRGVWTVTNIPFNANL